MADTINGVNVNTGEEYQKISDLFPSVVDGNEYSIQNQSSNAVKLFIGAVKPDNNTDAYILLPAFPYPPATISQGENAVWVKGLARLAVQLG